MNPFHFLAELFTDPSYRLDRAYQEAERWVDSSPTIEDPIAAHAALEFARNSYEESREDIKELENKLVGLLKFSGGLAVAIFAAIRVGGTSLTLWSGISFVFLLLAMAVCLLGRRAMLRPGLSKPSGVMESFQNYPQHVDDQLARVYHLCGESLKVFGNAAAAKIQVATILILISLFCLGSAIAFERLAGSRFGDHQAEESLDVPPAASAAHSHL